MAKRKVENKTIEVILLQADKHLWEKYEVVKVRPIFAKNVLLPKNMAVLADAINKNNYGQKMAAAEEQRKKKAAGFDDLFMKIQNDNGILITRKTNKDHTLYAKVNEEDIAKAIHDIYGMEVDSHFFKLKKKINALGDFTVPFLYKEIKKDVIVRVEEEKEEKKPAKEEKAE